MNKSFVNFFINQRLRSFFTFCFVFAAATFFAAHPTTAQEKSNDWPPLKDLNGYFQFNVPDSIEAWESRKQDLKTNLKLSLGLLPYPDRTPLNAKVHGAINKGEYTIEKVYFESLPGFYVTGNLYTPANVEGKIPAVLCPHGHFQNGRFHKASDEAIEAEIKSGAEEFRSNARSILQSRCANLAKMGCVVFHYDMLGYADNSQISYEIAHRFAKQRANIANPKAWGLFSPMAELNLQSVMGLQTWNSIRCLDFLESLPHVDSKRIGVTGASGGGTQTFLLCALDDRPAAAFPAVMVSTAMQGGCTCENCCYLRVATGNVELAAMFAPKPMGLTSADDWTKEMATKGFPELRRLYAMYDQRDNVHLTARNEFGHNYNQISREAMYRWFKKHLWFEGEPVETEIEFVEPDLLSVFDKTSQRNDAEFESNLLAGLKAVSDRKVADSVKQFRRENLIATFVSTVVKTTTESIGNTIPTSCSKFNPDPEAARLDFEFDDSTKSLVMLSVDGNKVLNKTHPLASFVETAHEQSWNVGAFQNDWIRDADRQQTRRVNNPRESLAYTIGYNAPQVSIRALGWRDLLLARLESSTSQTKPTAFLVALDGCVTEIALNAKSISTNPGVGGIIANTHGFRFSQITDIRDPSLLPGAVKYGDLPGMLSLAAPKPMLLVGEDETSVPMIVQAYAAAGKPENLTLIKTIPNGKTEHEIIVDWIKQH